MKVRAALGLLFILSVLAGCEFLGFGYWSWHQKLTVVVQTPTGEVTGSSVGAVKISRNPEWLKLGGEGGPSYSFRGEAIVVEVAPGRYLFATLEGYGWETAWKIFMPAHRPKSREEAGEYYSTLQNTRRTRILKDADYPLLVTFDDIGDPASLKRVNPNDLVASFGEGYQLKSIELTITDEPVTKGSIEKILLWLAEVGRERGSLIPNLPRRRSAASDPSIQYLGPLEFSTELYR
ncbi:hypothetical protein IB238_06935 [Rhizobium sp. ARZ01]|uniref:hypothetical protein n=1 Tax=Rhizobium sp. ARZ01 TaxID=2769313 RepID=UPI00177F1CD0|nr:hypothetical protein [Rhizobium sp. ARZ01]MBD9372358.1 hypothetical protein [Rhizobium sp. ARZ01]